jgi:4,5-DOPA dioxygenase extradiol
VLVVGSGNVVHNLGRIDLATPDEGTPWAQRFDEEARALMTSAPGDMERLRAHADFGLAVPTPDHFIPALYVAGLAAASGGRAEVLVDGYVGGSLSMTSYTLDADCVVEPVPARGSAPLPDVPPDETNL